jgi:hypothetical protein
VRRSAAVWLAAATVSVGGVALAAITRIDQAATVDKQAERVRDARPSVGGIVVAMQRYGLIVAGNGSNWYFQGAPSSSRDDDDLDQLKSVSGDWFEVVDTGPIRR